MKRKKTVAKTVTSPRKKTTTETIHDPRSCVWPGTNDLLKVYHDEEWGHPKRCDTQHFEFLILEAAQAGLSWLTVLKRREGYKKAFANFDPKKVAYFTREKVEQLLQNPEIIRNRLKIEAVVNNAKKFLEIQKEFGSFDNYLWSFTGNKSIVNKWKKGNQIPATTPLSDRVSEDLKKRGFKFVGSTVIYSHLQAVGIINDHLVTCFRYKEVQL